MLFTYFALLIFLKIKLLMFTVKIFNLKQLKITNARFHEKYESIDLETPLFFEKSYPLG